MKKINYHDFKKKLQSLKKTYFTLYELEKFYDNKKNSLKNLLSRWSKEELIISLGNGFYCFDMVTLDYLNLACTLVKPSYISFEYALNYHGLIDQVSEIITLTSTDRHKFIHMSAYTFEYTKIKEDLFFDFYKVGNFYIASAEKAFLDTIYLICRNKRLVDLKDLDVKKLNKSRLFTLAKKYPNYVREKLQNLIMRKI